MSICIFNKLSVLLTISAIVILNSLFLFVEIEKHDDINAIFEVDNMESQLHLDFGRRRKAVTKWFTTVGTENSHTTTLNSRGLSGKDEEHNNIFKREKILLETEMKNYTTKHNGRDWKQLQMVNGGEPIRNIIVTTWRSGSTFLGEAISSHPGTFYNFEPLMSFANIHRVRSGKLVNGSLYIINNLLKCNYSKMEGFLKAGTHKDMLLHKHNHRLRQYCFANNELCGDANFLSGMCQIFPFQVMKLVRLKLKLVEELIQDETLDVRILYLVRDPRAVLHSRRQSKSWCKPSADCWKPHRLCSDLVADFHSAAELREKYPNKLMAVRYEDIALNPFSGIKKVLEFFRLAIEPDVKTFLKKHTIKTVGDELSTFRDSKATPFKWARDISKIKNETIKIQSLCKDALNLWGYQKVDLENNNSISQNDLLLEPPWKEMIVPMFEENV